METEPDLKGFLALNVVPEGVGHNREHRGIVPLEYFSNPFNSSIINMVISFGDLIIAILLYA